MQSKDWDLLLARAQQLSQGPGWHHMVTSKKH